MLRRRPPCKVGWIPKLPEVTITAAPGADPDSVTITAAPGADPDSVTITVSWGVFTDCGEPLP